MNDTWDGYDLLTEQLEELPAYEIERFWAFEFARHRPRLSKSEMVPFQLRAAWRVCRIVFLASGRLKPYERLCELEEGFDVPLRLDPSKDFSHCDPHPVNVLPHALVDEACLEAHALRTVAALDLIARHIPAERKREFFYGLEDMVNYVSPKAMKESWPSTEEILGFEDLLVHQATMRLAKEGFQRAAQAMQESLLLSSWEADSLLALCRRRTVEITSATVEEKRAIMEIRLELMATDQDSPVRERLGALKQLAIVQGLSRSEPETAQALFQSVVYDLKKVGGGHRTAEEAVKRIPAEVRQALPPPPG